MRPSKSDRLAGHCSMDRCQRLCRFQFLCLAERLSLLRFLRCHFVSPSLRTCTALQLLSSYLGTRSANTVWYWCQTHAADSMQDARPASGRNQKNRVEIVNASEKVNALLSGRLVHVQTVQLGLVLVPKLPARLTGSLALPWSF